MIRTFAELYGEIGRHVFDTSGAAIINHKLWTNLGYHRVVYDVDYPFLRKSGTFVTVAGTKQYTPEPNALKFLNVRIPAQNLYLAKSSVERLDRARPYYQVDTNRGCPGTWYLEDWVGAYNQPSVAAAVYLASDATETAATTVTVEGVVNGEVDREVETLTASAIPNATTTKLFSEITSISKSAITVGKISAKQTNASGTVLCNLGPLMRTRRYIRIGLEPTPDAVYTVYYRYIPWLAELVNDSDVPLIPDEDIPVIIDAAMLIAAENHGDPAVITSREKAYAAKLEHIRNRMGDDAETVQKWQFGSGSGASKYPVIAGDYTSYLRNMFWG